MSTDALLALVLQNPEDDHARLVYADALQERGDPRGELISVQCAIAAATHVAKAGEPSPKAHLEGLIKRDVTLLDKYKKTWTSFANAPGTRWHFSRGFIEHVEIDAEPFVACAEELFAREPVRRLSIRKVRSGWLPFVLEAIPESSRLTRLSLKNNRLLVTDVAALAQARVLENLHALDLAQTLPIDGGDDYVRAVADSPSLSKLRWLRWMGGMTDDGVRALAASTELVLLEHLDIGQSRVSGNSMDALANAAVLGRTLKSLNLLGAKLDNDGAITLLSSTKLVALERVDVSQNLLTDDILPRLLAAPLVQRLKVLYLKQRGIHAATRKQLVAKFGDRVDFDSGMHDESDA